ncbi:hypothetical protein CTI12_AA460620 [Artemisia annua]|uniref:Reverse transcriptase zinc-binding domain-containing protein n=1 Tax=Artemisia annua TaxID=35608 RepID=A0A2U1LS74_ARTAN|nr:hypothetical protein CTI12_AA460620 [Artemisia annua]
MKIKVLLFVALKAKDLGLFSQVDVGRAKSFSISHLQFVDDTLIFCDATKENLLNVKRILRCFQLSAGLKINFLKSMLYGVGIDERLVRGWGDNLGCSVGSIPFRSLGCLLRYGNKKEALWKKLIDAKYGKIKCSLSPAVPSKASVSPVWKKITDIFHPSSPFGVVAKKGLLHCVANKSGPVCDFGMWENGQWKWNVKLRRNLFDWEVEQFDSFMLILKSVVMMATRNDKVVWSFDTLGKFSSRSFDKEMEKSSYSDPILHAVWKFKAPPKARLLCWQSIVRKLPTRDMLLRIGIIAENQSGCPLCNSCIESVDHLFVHCKFVLSIWLELISAWDCEWVIPRNMRAYFPGGWIWQK